MSWQAFSQFMWGISDLCFAAYDRLQRAEHHQSAVGYGADSAYAQHTGYDFRRYMAALAEATGIHLSGLHENSASFRFSFSGEAYIGSVVSAGGRVCIGVFSTVQFPRRSIPSDLVRAVKRLNAKMRNYDFEVMHVDDCSLFYIKFYTLLTVLTPCEFKGLLEEMAGNMAVLDSKLMEHGYAN